MEDIYQVISYSTIGKDDIPVSLAGFSLQGLIMILVPCQTCQAPRLILLSQAASWPPELLHISARHPIVAHLPWNNTSTSTIIEQTVDSIYFPPVLDV